MKPQWVAEAERRNEFRSRMGRSTGKEPHPQINPIPSSEPKNEINPSCTSEPCQRMKPNQQSEPEFNIKTETISEPSSRISPIKISEPMICINPRQRSDLMLTFTNPRATLAAFPSVWAGASEQDFSGWPFNFPFVPNPTGRRLSPH